MYSLPLTSFESEFESLYSVDDLFIGRVSIVGIYKGKIKIEKLRNSFEFFQELGQKTNSSENSEVHDSQFDKPQVIKLKSEGDDISYHYIDVLAVVQSIDPMEDKKGKRKGNP